MHGRHSIGIGFQLARLEDNRVKLPVDGTSASFTFANSETAGFSSTGTLLTTTGNAYASYLLGAVDSAAVQEITWFPPGPATTTRRIHSGRLDGQLAPELEPWVAL